MDLDTSGAVERGEAYGGQCFWSDLSPFTQGYVEALFASAVVELRRDAEDRVQMNLEDLGFRHLAPETLARIIADCEAIQATFPVSPNRSGGWQAWHVRRDGGFDMGGKWPGLPPLTVQIGDDGKVRFTP